MDKITNEELLEECLYIYDNDITSLSLHIFSIFRRKKPTNISRLSIEEQLLNKSKIDKYRQCFIEVMDSFKEDIEKYKTISEFNIDYSYSNLSFIKENIKYLKEEPRKKQRKIKNDIIEIINFSEKILNELEDI